MGIKSIALAATALVLSTSGNAAVVNTLNGVNYEWLEFTHTQGLSRDQVEVQIATASVGDTLFGYQYASRALVQDLLLSYSAFDGYNGWHSAVGVISGVNQFIDDFGTTYVGNPTGSAGTLTTVEGVQVSFQSGAFNEALFIYGDEVECTSTDRSCSADIAVYHDFTGNAVMAYQTGFRGWDASDATPTTFADIQQNSFYASMLVRVSPVPVPAAVWLFGSGLLGLVGVARRKKA